ncbi:MAG: MFS transporter [Acidobacteriaceae bacterium]|nr:MFS transporter [Acidobacteriaceae bacterium]
MAQERQEGRWQFAFRALRSRNFRLFFAGQSVSLIGTWMTRVATSWLVYRLTKSPFLLGAVSFAGQIPLFFLAPIAGVWVDRSDRHKMLILTQVLSMVQSFALAALALTGVITIWQLAALMLFQGFINALDMPARQSFLVQMVDSREELPNAIALNSSMVNAARLIGPAIAGVIIGSLGEGVCFLMDGISYIAVIASLFAMRVPRQTKRPTEKNTLEELREGWRYVSGSHSIRSILLLLALISLLGMPYTVLMPVFAGQVLHGGPHTLGYLMAAIGVGALLGAIGLAIRKTVLGLGRVIPLSAAIFGAALMGFAFSRSLWLSTVLLLAAGYGMMRNLAASNTLLQTILEEGKRGRVMSFYSMAFAGMSPFGSLLAGVAAARLGAPATVAASGVFCIVGAALFARQLPRMREQIRPIYVQLGILPAAVNAESASEVQTAS